MINILFKEGGKDTVENRPKLLYEFTFDFSNFRAAFEIRALS